MRIKTNPSIDRRQFVYHVVKTKEPNAPHNIPRGGIRL